MQRRSFLLWGGASALIGGGSIAAYRHWHEIQPTVHTPGRREGHFLRDGKALPAPSRLIETDIAIFGSGIAGLTAAWKLAREGARAAVMIDGPEANGNAAGGAYGELAYPTGAHYLPIPSTECVHVREILADLGVLQGDHLAEKPQYDERFLLHAPAERLLYQGRWQEGILPHEGVPQAEPAEHRRFLAHMDQLRSQRGADGRRVFVFPAALASRDPAWLALDRISFAQWLDQQGYRAPTLRWYADYCCRDDYGALASDVSAWAGLQYFCGRGGQASNGETGAWLTWPGGLAPLAEGLAARSGIRRESGTAVSLEAKGAGVEALCFRIVDGKPQTYLVKARKAICAMPLFVASRVVKNIGSMGFDPAQHLPPYRPWLVSNFLLSRFPLEQAEAPLSWDNVVYDGEGLGYVVSTHQDLRQAPPEKTVFTSYVALAGQDATAARRWMDKAGGEELLELASRDLAAAYGGNFRYAVERVDITLRAHAMASPAPGFLSNAGLEALRAQSGPILFAHADLSSYSVFEEASWWGYQAALRALA